MRGASEENDFRAGFIFLVLNKFIRICFANIINRREYNKFSGLMDEVVKGFFVFFFFFLFYGFVEFKRKSTQNVLHRKTQLKNYQSSIQISFIHSIVKILFFIIIAQHKPSLYAVAVPLSGSKKKILMGRCHQLFRSF